MKTQTNISGFEALGSQELQKISGGILFTIAMCIAADVVVGLVLYGAFMEGYNDGMKAAG